MWLTRFCIQRPIIVAMFFIALAVFGTLSYFKLGRSLNPNVTFPIVLVTAEYPGASPSDMERFVIKPIEDQMDGIENLDRLSATAQEGTAAVIVQFKIDTDINYAAIDVQRRVDIARTYMPTDLDPPIVDRSAGDQQAPILTLALSSKTLSDTGLSDVVHDRILPDILRIPNIQSVDTRGEVKREFHVFPIPERLLATGETLPDIFYTLQNNNATLPGGRIDTASSETVVSVHGEIVHASDMLPIPLSATFYAQKGLRIEDVATIDDGHVDQRYISRFNNAPTVLLDLNRVVSSDEIKSTAIARDQLKTLEKKYPQVVFTEVDAPAEYTQASLAGVVQSLGEGILLTAIVLMLFLHAWRNAIVVMVAIPTSLLATVIAMRLFGFTLDIISLMGLSLTIGILVDDSIVVLENITRHRDMGEKPEDAALSGRAEIGGAAVAITLVDVVVFLPMAFLSGIVGKFMKEFGVVVVVATLFSLFVSFTLTPVLAAKWSMLKRSTAPPRWLAWFQVGYERVLRVYHDRMLPYALAHGKRTVAFCGALVFSAIALVPLGLVQTEFVPSTQDGEIAMTFTYPIGTPIAQTDHAVQTFVERVMQVPGIEKTISTVGYKPAGWGSSQGGNYARMHATLFKNRRQETNRAVADIRKLAVAFPGATITVGGDNGDPIYYTVAGPDDAIDAAAEKFATYIRSIPGTVNVQTGSEAAANRLNINIDREKAALIGVNPGDVATAARIAIGGAVATRVRTPSGLVDVRVQLPAEYRNKLEEVRNIRVRAGDGSIYRVADVASFTYDKAPTKIERLDKQRVVRVTGAIESGATTLGVVTQKIEQAIKTPGFFPPGVNLRSQGDSEFFEETMSSMSIAMLTSFSLVYALMVVLYGSFWMPFIVMFSVPLAIIGALYGLAIAHQTLNLFSMIGIIMLFGLVAKNGILLVDYANTLRRRGLKYDEAIMQAANTRFRPILMTTFSMVFGMLPLALGLAEGAEFRVSMGTVLIGGLLSSLVLTLFLVPVIYMWVVGRIERKAQKRAARALKDLPELTGVGTL
ncbi:MAG: efflux RND transporter permease subunit [Vulcanimicrobiaceae bacterium]